MATSALPAIEPHPPRAPGHLPWAGSGFSLLRHKVPTELFAGRRTMPHDLFGREDVEVYLENLHEAMEVALEELSSAGCFEIFEFMRRLAHRMGLASWGGLGPATYRFLDPLVQRFDRLDSAESFVFPMKGFVTVATRKRAERRALEEIEAIYREILAAREGEEKEGGDLFDRICTAWSDVEGPEREIGIARDVVLVHMGSQSNLFAAMAWTLVHLLERPDLIEEIRGGDTELLERCASESIRLAQRSIVLRRVLRPVELADEERSYKLEPGVFATTMMSVTNTSAAPGLDRYDPDHYRGREFQLADALPARELVTTFGHGRHACPAQRFSISAICDAVGALITDYDFSPRYRDPQPLRRQIGGIARADRRCWMDYRVRNR
ncbi:MAG: cytochrome [Deltaproteobacteria bacterium]|nr:cytochrome [Deltaproteobacteria bacterium]